MEGSIDPSRSSTVSTRNPVFAGKRRQVRSQVLLTNGASGTYSSILAFFRVRIPSSRLHAIGYLTYEPDGSEDTAIPVSWQATMDAWMRNEDGKPMRANNIFTNASLPTSWEAVTGVFEWRGVVNVPPGGTGAAPGKLWLTAYWEPAPGESEMPQEELESLFNSCSIETAPIGTFQTVGG